MEYPAYVRPRVKLEFGARSTGEPATRRPVVSDLAPAFPELDFPSATPRVMRTERTFWEKASLDRERSSPPGRRADGVNTHPAAPSISRAQTSEP